MLDVLCYYVGFISAVLHHRTKLDVEMVFLNMLQVFSRGSVCNFIMTTDRSLGELLFLRIWHDNSGDGVKAGWFLDKVVVEDLTTPDK